VTEVFPNMPDFICHFASESSIELIPAISAYGLILWILDGKNPGGGYGFPFDRPHLVFTQRLCSAYAQLQEIKKIALRGQWRDNRPLHKLSGELEAIFNDKILRRTLAQIELKLLVFDQLRDAMRIAPESGSEGLNCDGAEDDIQTIEGNVDQFRQQLADDPTYANKDYQKMIDQIDKYEKKLFADPIAVDTPDGKVFIQPQRTNDIMERFFRDFKTGHRRKAGHNSMNRTLQTMLADTPLAKNLQNETYMKILLDSKPALEALFADIDFALVRKQLSNSQASWERIPAKIKKIISRPEFVQAITHIFCGTSDECAA